MRIAPRTTITTIALLAVAFAVSCTDTPQAESPSSTTQTANLLTIPTAPTPTSPPESDQPGAGTTPPLPDSLPEPAGSAADAVAPVTELLVISDEERNCLEEAIAADPDLHAALELDPSKESPGGQRALLLAEQCTIFYTTTQNFVDQAARHTPTPLTQEQATCLATEFRELDSTVLRELLNTVADPANVDPEAEQAYISIYDTCDVEVVPPE